jgi:predicted AlkP superfamily pyrophosphatase or phosphodiesterase
MPAFLNRAALAVAFASATAAASAQSSRPPAQPPKLIVFMVVDQLQGDMLDRYKADLSKGYARLMNHGAWFTNGFQDHAITETAPGHASTMSGRFPASTGIISNSVGVVDRNYPLLIGLRNEAGASPNRFNGTTLTDWLTAHDARTHTLAVSRKDRGAILPTGKSKQDVYWYSPSGNFTTSTYYRDTLPTWVKAFNDRRLTKGYAGKEWDLTLPKYSEPDTVFYENNGANFIFPHKLPADTLAAANSIMATPMMDSVLALFALEGLNQTGIGKGPQTDILLVSFSATDYIGHAYGPDSREAHENEVRLDQTIGWFIDSLYKVRDSSTVMFALTGDHGDSPIPELAREKGIATGNQGLRVNLHPVVDSVREAVFRSGGDESAIVYDGELFSVDRGKPTGGMKPDSILSLFRKLALKVPGVYRVDKLSDLRKKNLANDPIGRRWTHQIPATAPIDLAITLTRYSYWYSVSAGPDRQITATHGSPWDQDAHVPIIFYGPWVKPGKYTAFARTVDMAPTLAAIARVKPTERLDGVVLKQAIR